MKILERKVARTFLTVLAGALIAFLTLFVVVDLVENLDKFIDKGSPLKAPLLYYLNYIPYIAVLILPIAMLLAAMSTMGGMVRDNELMALKASGVSAYRPIVTLAILALLVTGAAFVVGETVVPRTNERKEMILNEYVNQQGAVSRNETVNRTLDLGSGRILFVKRYNNADQLALDVMLAESVDVRVVNVLQADRMRYLGDSSRWELENVVERSWKDGKETFQREPRLERVLQAVTPEELALRTKKPEEMGYSELKGYVERGQARGRDVRRALVDLFMKVSLPFANFIVVLFGAALASVRRRTGLAVGFTSSILICFVYYVMIRTGQALGYNGDLSPVVGAWLGNGVFGLLSLRFLWQARF